MDPGRGQLPAHLPRGLPVQAKRLQSPGPVCHARRRICAGHHEVIRQSTHICLKVGFAHFSYGAAGKLTHFELQTISH
jgi:hypothetical protein